MNSGVVTNTNGKLGGFLLKSLIVRVSIFLHHYLIWFIVSSYLLASVFPKLGLQMRDVALWHMNLFQQNTPISIPMVLLAFLLLNAGLGIRVKGLHQWKRSGPALILGLLGNFFIPVLFIFGSKLLMQFWHNPDEVQNVLVGLALIASMPVAGSSTAWSQNADGDMNVSLGLVLLTTALSPFTTPMVLHSVSLITVGDYSEDLQELATYGTGAFLTFFVLLPSIIGIVIRAVVGEDAILRIKPYQKLLNILVLLALSYSNAAVSLPQAVRQPDGDFLIGIAVVVTVLCVIAFATGWAIAELTSATPSQQAALMFGLGMNNNGTGLVLASATLADHPRVMLPIIFYNLVQHLIASIVDHFLYANVDDVKG